MIGGIAANNASGMCCGTAQNSYRTVAGLRLVLQDGTLLDTADPASRDQFRHSHKHVLDALDALGRQVQADTALAERIRRKYEIKNTTGYSLNALVDYEDPFDILVHLMIGSEGTLGFISEVTYHTVEEHPCKASALMIFPHIEHAATAAAILKEQPVAAVELMDRASMRSVENKAGMPDYLKALGPDTAALLVETRAFSAGELSEQIRRVTGALGHLPFERPAAFTDQAAENIRLWNIRKGLFPAVGAVRDTGTTVIIEDVAFPIDRLARATLQLQEVFRRYRYDEAIIFGHALEGNLHFVFTQDFGRHAGGRALPPVHGRRLRHGGEHLRRLAQGRARHRAEHGALRGARVGAGRLRGHAAHQGDLRPEEPPQPRGHPQPRPAGAHQGPEGHARGRPDRRQVHRVRLLRGELPVQEPHAHPAPAHRRAARDRAAEVCLREPGPARRSSRRATATRASRPARPTGCARWPARWTSTRASTPSRCARPTPPRPRRGWPRSRPTTSARSRPRCAWA